VRADAPRKLWQFDAGGPIAGPVIRDGQSFYFASKDTYVYRVDELNSTTASLIWKHQVEAIPDRPPRVTATAVYQYARGRGVTAIHKRSGKALWSLPEGVDLLAEGAGKAYVFTKINTLAVMDNSQGKPLYSVNFGPVIRHAANTTDAMIYIADGHGRVTCLRPVRHRTRNRAGRWISLDPSVPTMGQGRRS
jgi:outer membrane protein assembly factor BamB